MDGVPVLRDKNILLLRSMEIRYREVRLMRFDTTDISTLIKIAFRRIPAMGVMYYVLIILMRNCEEIVHAPFFHCPLSVALMFLVTPDSIKVLCNYLDCKRDRKTVGVPLSVYLYVISVIFFNYADGYYLAGSLLRLMRWSVTIPYSK